MCGENTWDLLLSQFQGHNVVVFSVMTRLHISSRLVHLVTGSVSSLPMPPSPRSWRPDHSALWFYEFDFFFFFFWPCRTACGILVRWPGIEPTPPALGAQSLSHWTAREVPKLTFLDSTYKWDHTVSVVTWLISFSSKLIGCCCIFTLLSKQRQNPLKYHVLRTFKQFRKLIIGIGGNHHSWQQNYNENNSKCTF